MHRKQILIALIALAAVGLIALIVYSLIPRATIILSVAPEQFTVSINGVKREADTGEIVTVSPGEIEVTLSRDEFDTYTERVVVKNGERKEILVALTAQTPAAELLLKTDKSQEIIQRITGKKIEQGTKELGEKNPILKELPIRERFYTIIACNSEKYPDDKTKFAICIQLFDLDARQSAIDNLRLRGYSLDDYEFIFVDSTYKNIQEQSGE